MGKLFRTLTTTLIALGLLATYAAPSSGTHEVLDVSLSPGTVSPGDELVISGGSLAQFREIYQVRIGGLIAWDRTWTQTRIVVLVPAAEPGPQPVTLVPAEEWLLDDDGELVASPLPSIDLGTVEITKYILPGEETDVVAGSVKIRLVEGADPDDVVVDGDEHAPLFPDHPDPLLGRWHVVAVPEGEEADRILHYAGRDDVEVAHGDSYGQPARAPNDPRYPEQWGLRKARLTAAWEVRTTASPIAIIDTGIRATHDEFAGRITHNTVCTNSACIGGTTPAPCDGHGTAVASVAAARTNDGKGMAGAAWSADIGSYKVMDPNDVGVCEFTWAKVERAISQAVLDGFRILNMSLSGTPPSTSTENTINWAWNQGAFLIATAGNHGASTQRWPGAYTNVFAVASTDHNDAKASNSGYGSWVALAAPGVNINIASGWADNAYTVSSGTSYAAPHVAGAAALLHRLGHSNTGIRTRLIGLGDAVDWDPTRTGERRLNAYRALVQHQGCIRDIPVGAWVRDYSQNNRVYVVAPGNVLRHVPDTLVRDSWDVIDDIVPMCGTRRAEFSFGPSWGYRPGRLVNDPSNGRIYLITTDGSDRGLPVKRHITSTTVMSCFGWKLSSVIPGNATSLANHPTGTSISSCPSTGPRSFPNGSLLVSSTGRVYVVEGGTKRHIPSMQVLTSWFATSEVVSATSTELSLLPSGASWGFRHGRLIHPSGTQGQWVITDDGTLRARGAKRRLSDMINLRERGWESVPLTTNVPSSVVNLHATAPTLLNADDMP